MTMNGTVRLISALNEVQCYCNKEVIQFSVSVTRNQIVPPPARTLLRTCNRESYVGDFPSSPSDDGEATGSRSDYDDGEWTKGPSRTP